MIAAELGDLVEDPLPVADPLGWRERVDVVRSDGDEEVEVQAEVPGCEEPRGREAPDGFGGDGAGDLEV